MKISELIVPKKMQDTTSSGTIYSIESEPSAQDVVPQNNVPEKIVAETVDNQILEMPDHSAIAEGVSQILRRKPGGAPTKDSDAPQDQGKAGSLPSRPPVSPNLTRAKVRRSEPRGDRRWG